MSLGGFAFGGAFAFGVGGVWATPPFGDAGDGVAAGESVGALATDGVFDGVGAEDAEDDGVAVSTAGAIGSAGATAGGDGVDVTTAGTLPCAAAPAGARRSTTSAMMPTTRIPPRATTIAMS